MIREGVSLTAIIKKTTCAAFQWEFSGGGRDVNVFRCKMFCQVAEYLYANILISIFIKIITSFQ
jgi:hypothetical protein